MVRPPKPEREVSLNSLGGFRTVMAIGD